MVDIIVDEAVEGGGGEEEDEEESGVMGVEATGVVLVLAGTRGCVAKGPLAG